MRVKTAAKINLALDVTGRLPNGYHSIESVFQTVGIYDEVTVELTESGIELSCEVPERFVSADPIPCDERNIAYKAAREFLAENALDAGCRIHIKKGIPSQAGMGGGSTDAAAVLYCLSELTGKTFSSPEKLGADVPFFLMGGTAYVTGIGEKTDKISDYSGKILVIAKGKEGVSTAEAYKAIDELENPQHPDAGGLARVMAESQSEVYKYIGNLFEYAVNISEVRDIKEIMTLFGARAACMTGSGSAVFGIFETEEKAEECAESLKKAGYFAVKCVTVPESFKKEDEV